METSQSLFQGVLIFPPATKRLSWGTLTTLHRARQSLHCALEAMQVGALAAWWLLSRCWQRIQSHREVAELAVSMPCAAAATENRPETLNLKRQTNTIHANFSVGLAADVDTERCKNEDSHSSWGALFLHCW